MRPLQRSRQECLNHIKPLDKPSDTMVFRKFETRFRGPGVGRFGNLHVRAFHHPLPVVTVSPPKPGCSCPSKTGPSDQSLLRQMELLHLDYNKKTPTSGSGYGAGSKPKSSREQSEISKMASEFLKSLPKKGSGYEITSY